MAIITYVLLGLLSGFIASMLVTGSGAGLLMNLVVGASGAFLGGGLFHLLGRTGVTGFNVWSVCVSVVGAVLLLVTYRALSKRRPSNA